MQKNTKMPKKILKYKYKNTKIRQYKNRKIQQQNNTKMKKHKHKKQTKNTKIISSDPRHVGAVCRKWEPFYGTFFIQERQLEELEIVSCIRKQNRTNSNPMFFGTKLNELKTFFFLYFYVSWILIPLRHFAPIYQKY